MVKRIPLDSVCEKKIATLSSQYDGLIDYVDISSVDNVEKRIVSMQSLSAKEAPSRAKQLLEVGDILVSTVRPNLNAVAMVQQRSENLVVGSTGYCVLRCKSDIDSRYVFHFCQSPYFITDMTSQATGASYPAVSSGIVRSSTIPFRSNPAFREASVVQLEQIRTIDKSRIDNYLGKVTSGEMAKIEKALSISLAMEQMRKRTGCAAHKYNKKPKE